MTYEKRQRLEWADGSRVLLNTRSAFSSNLDGLQRVTHLYEGEAFFEAPTAKDCRWRWKLAVIVWTTRRCGALT